MVLMSELSVQETEQLVGLRLALDDAVSRARRSSKYNRGTRVVALDAVVERANYIVAVTRGITVKQNVAFEDLVNQLKQHLGDLWNPGVLPDIRQMHRARNAAQHEGLSPDRELLSPWASACDKYVQTLVEAQFGVDVRRVTLSRAIEDKDLQFALASAEVALEAGEFSDAFEAAIHAYDAAHRRWLGMQNTRSLGRIRSTDSSDTAKRLDALISNLDAQTFVHDVAEACWFAAARRDPSSIMTADDAERALAFTFEWIFEFERALSTWTPDRRRRANVAARRTRAQDGPARVDDVDSIKPNFEGYEARFQLADVPGESDYSEWATMLSSCLRSDDTGRNWWVHDDGSVFVALPAGDTDVSRALSYLREALAKSETTFSEKRAAKEATEREVALRRARFDRETETMDLPTWVRQVQWGPRFQDGDSGVWLLTLVRGLSTLDLDGEGAAHQGHGRDGIRELLLEHDAVETCYGIGNDLALGPVTSAEHLKAILLTADVRVASALQAKEASKYEELSQMSRDADTWLRTTHGTDHPVSSTVL